MFCDLNTEQNHNTKVTNKGLKTVADSIVQTERRLRLGRLGKDGMRLNCLYHEKEEI
jgi:hypothetical protein